jgi:hypothetical protein
MVPETANYEFLLLYGISVDDPFRDKTAIQYLDSPPFGSAAV